MLSFFFFPPVGGGEYFILSVLKHLNSLGYNCLAACYSDGNTNLDFKSENVLEWDGIPVFQLRIKHAQDIKELYQDVSPDLVITQSYDAPVIVEVAKKMGIKTILGTHFWRNICHVEDGFHHMLTRPLDSVVLLKSLHRVFSEADETYVNSEFMQKAVDRYVGVHVNRIIHPILDVDRVISKGEIKKEYVTLINSDHGKGGDLFIQIAINMPQQKFLVVGLGTPIIPENVKINSIISQIPNVEIIEKIDNISRVYGVTKVLLAPSLVDETFSMVALEAMANGIPVLGSLLGNLPYLIGDSGLLLDTNNKDLWIESIKGLMTDHNFYSKLSSEGILLSKKYDPKLELKVFSDMVKKCIGDSK